MIDMMIVVLLAGVFCVVQRPNEIENRTMQKMRQINLKVPSWGWCKTYRGISNRAVISTATYFTCRTILEIGEPLPYIGHWFTCYLQAA